MKHNRRRLLWSFPGLPDRAQSCRGRARRVLLLAMLLATTLVTVLAAPAALADSHRSDLRRSSSAYSSGQDNGRESQGISRNEAAQIARRASGGRVLGVELRGNRYFVRVLVDGKRVRTVKVDARTGAVR